MLMPERQPHSQRSAKEFQKNIAATFAGAGAWHVSKLDETKARVPSFIEGMIEKSKISAIPENYDYINWYGADLFGPFSTYFALRAFTKLSRAKTAAIALSIPFAFEALQYAARNNPSAEADGGKYDPVDLACYATSIVAAISLDRIMNRQDSLQEVSSNEALTLPEQNKEVSHKRLIARKKRKARNKNKRNR